MEAFVEHHLCGAAQENRGADGDDDEATTAHGAAGRIARRSSSSPTSRRENHRRHTSHRQRQPGQTAEQPEGDMPPSITNSPWAKLMMPDTLKIMVKPSATRA